jgi:hypothetical protein
MSLKSFISANSKLLAITAVSGLAAFTGFTYYSYLSEQQKEEEIEKICQPIYEKISFLLKQDPKLRPEVTDLIFEAIVQKIKHEYLEEVATSREAKRAELQGYYEHMEKIRKNPNKNFDNKMIGIGDFQAIRTESANVVNDLIQYSVEVILENCPEFEKIGVKTARELLSRVIGNKNGEVNKDIKPIGERFLDLRIENFTKKKLKNKKFEKYWNIKNLRVLMRIRNFYFGHSNFKVANPRLMLKMKQDFVDSLLSIQSGLESEDVQYITRVGKCKDDFGTEISFEDDQVMQQLDDQLSLKILKSMKNMRETMSMKLPTRMVEKK